MTAPWQRRGPAQPAAAITEVLNDLSRGERGAWSKVFQLLYADLRRVAGAQLRREAHCQTLQPTDLVHAAYLRLSSFRKKQWENRTHFCASDAFVMRRILVDQARRRRLRQRDAEALTLNGSSLDSSRRTVDLLDLDRALNDLCAIEERLGRIVELRYFGGLTVEETADVLGISAKTVKRDWCVARAFLHGRIREK
jgi:RNA polymerase sigma-70 factor, ECF subfamily